MAAPRGDSQSNAGVESWIHRVKGLVRSVNGCSESYLRRNIDPRHPTWDWLLERCAELLNRFRHDKNGTTGIQRVRGKRSHKQLCRFGERVLCLPLNVTSRNPSELWPTWVDGIWLGLRRKTDEDIIGTPDGIVRTRSVRRIAEGQRRDPDYFFQVKPTTSGAHTKQEYVRNPFETRPGWGRRRRR